MVMKVSEDTEDTGIPARVFDRQRPHFGPGIAMSRSIGDTNATALGVVPEPDYTRHQIRYARPARPSPPGRPVPHRPGGGRAS